ncbi:MAG: hypothetical protein Q8L60_10860 [Gammaproteobacteria bacterium]|nr:hypothetical protein [Gammaproteobacteria bacterium]MDP2346848.1 hypothetical protein [Gammaproteobacteria bacterium]
MSYIDIAETTMLGDLMKCVVEQLKVLPKAWQAMSEQEQQETLDRIELQTADAVRQAVRIISSHGQINVPAKIESVTYKDGCKVVLKAVGGIANTIHLAEAEGQIVAVIIPETENLLGDEGKPEADPDQRGLELGHEYNDADFEGMPGSDDMPDDDDDAVDDDLDHDDEYEAEEETETA